MTRPKVPPDQRQRTAQACESCKRRKQKCNGQCPCNTCTKRSFNCVYGDRESHESIESPVLKKRATDDDFPDHNSTSKDELHANEEETPSPTAPQKRSPLASQRSSRHILSPRADPIVTGGEEDRTDQQAAVGTGNPAIHDGVNAPQLAPQPTSNGQSKEPLLSSTASQSGQDEEAVVYSQTRMLQDPTGRLLYVGDSASLSFLQLLRMMVENVSGPSPFTTDPRRHKIMESQFSLLSSTRLTHLLPERRTAVVLADSFFTNTHGLIHIFERHTFLRELEDCYLDPLKAEPSWLCLKNLVFAIGLLMATPRKGTAEYAIIERLRSEPVDRAHMFYMNAKSLHNPLTGFEEIEDADFWSIQALLLMTVYMLAKSKRNAAFALLGMAVRSAYALGLHREETMVIFEERDQFSRRNIWRSLFVLDRFLSCSLGRPTAICEEVCNGDALKPTESNPEPDILGFKSTFPNTAQFNQNAALSLDAAVRSCAVIGTILQRVYQQRKISTKQAQIIADECKQWPKALAPMLHWGQAATASPSHGIAILHVNLFYCHSIILLTRPFFLFILNAEIQKELNTCSTRNYVRMDKFSEACLIASGHTVLLVQNAFDAGYLPQRNPIVIYFLFAAALVLLANEFASLYVKQATDQYIEKSIAIMAYCAQSDPQASRLLYILSTFRDVVVQRRQQRLGNPVPDAALLSSFQSQYPPASFGTADQMNPNLTGNAANFAATENTLNQTTSPQTEQHQMDQTTNSHGAPWPTTIPQQQPFIPEFFSKTAALPLPQEDAPTGPVVSNPSIPLNGAPIPSLHREISLSNLLDLGALESDTVPQVQSSTTNDATNPDANASSTAGSDEHIDFDALWAWPCNTPAAVGTPRPPGAAGVGDLAGISGSAVPLFGVFDGE